MKKHKTVTRLIALLFSIALLSGCSAWNLLSESRASLPNNGKWKCETHQTIIVDFDNKTVTIDEIHRGELTITDETFLDARIPIDGTQGHRGLMGYCIIATNEKFCIKSTKNDEHWWFYNIT